MCLCLLRRSFLKSSLAASGLAACAPAVPQPEPVTSRSSSLRRRWIDVHCHVFNAQDVPLYEFIRRTRLRGIAGIASPLLAIVSGGLRHDAPTAAEELERLQRGAPPLIRDAALDRSALPDDDAFQGLARLRERTEQPIAANRATGRALGRATPSAARPNNAAPAGRDALNLFDAAFRETGIRTGPRPSGTPPRPSDEELQRFGELVQPTGRALGVSELQRYFAWGRMFSEDRNALTSRLAALYPGQELMLTPALVDYDRWLDAPDNALPRQYDVMEAIAVRRAREGLPVHAFLAFDPWRCLEARGQGRDTLADLKTRLARGGGIGVKLYPPMGFSAAGNAARPAESFPRALQRLTGGRPGPALDDMMDELFDFLVDQQIPVMAHCGQTNASRPEYAALAGPDYWRTALERKRPRRQELRLNLGHFGGIWELGTKDTEQRAWATEVAKLVDRYPNAYSDIGYFGSVLDGNADVLRQSGEFIAALATQRGSRLGEKLMYGSDWSMLGQEERPERYPDGALAVLKATWSGPREDDLRWRNAARYLGLARGDATRDRLLKFHAANNLDPAPLLRFDPGMAA